MPNTTRYCQTCDQEYAFTSGETRCPECGDTLVRWHDANTVALSTHTAERLAREARSTEEIGHLVGAELAHYKIERFLGQGGMARVFLATHTTLHRLCALKLLHAGAVDENPQVLDAFFSEARVAASLVHPHVVTLHNIGHAEGRHFIEMEYVHGNSLAHYLDTTGQVDALQATEFMRDVCAALAAAHSIGLVHRDIKPSNVLLTKQGTAKLADFGLARPIDSTKTRPRGVICGTPNYMAPELFHGGTATKQSDIYSMGVTFFALLTGKLPFRTASISELAAVHARREPIPLEDQDAQIPGSICEVLQRMLSHDVADRYEDATELLDTLRPLFGNLRPLRALIDKALEDVEHEIEGEGHAYTVKLTFDNGRSQRVRIEVTRDMDERGEMIRIFSVCGRACTQHYERVLHLNASISHGALAIQEIAGEPHFVMANVYPRATCDPIEVRRSVLDIAKYSDDLEALITGKDQF